MKKKENLPSKLCVCCGKPMVWRKKWAKVWSEVKYCSKRCRRTKEVKIANESIGRFKLEH